MDLDIKLSYFICKKKKNIAFFFIVLIYSFNFIIYDLFCKKNIFFFNEFIFILSQEILRFPKIC